MRKAASQYALDGPWRAGICIFIMHMHGDHDFFNLVC